VARSRRLAASRFIILILSAIFLASCSQTADVPSAPDLSSNHSVWVPLTLESGDLSTQQVPKMGPSQCGLYADYPHKSDTNNEQITGYGRVVCIRRVPSITITTSLARKNVFGYATVRTANSPVTKSTRAGTSYSSFKVVASVPCVNDGYRTAVSGSIRDIDGKVYSASNVYNYREVSTC